MPALSSDVALWIVNAALVIVGLIFVERKAVFWSVVASVVIPVYASIIQAIMPITGSLTGDMWMDLCCTVLLIALGNAIAYNAGASTGAAGAAFSLRLCLPGVGVRMRVGQGKGRLRWG